MGNEGDAAAELDADRTKHVNCYKSHVSGRRSHVCFQSAAVNVELVWKTNRQPTQTGTQKQPSQCAATHTSRDMYKAPLAMTGPPP